MVRKYSKKLKRITDLIEKSNENQGKHREKLDATSEIYRDNLLRELFSTIEKFNITIHNQQLIDNILDFADKKLNNATKKIIEEYEKEDNEEKIRNKELIKIIEQLEFQIKKLKDQNDSLTTKHINEVFNYYKFNLLILFIFSRIN